MRDCKTGRQGCFDLVVASKTYHLCILIVRSGPILEFKGSVRYVEKELKTLFSKIDNNLKYL